MLNLTYEWLLLLLVRPFYCLDLAQTYTGHQNRNSFNRRDELLVDLHNKAVSQCPTSAHRIIALLGAYRQLYHLRFTPDTIVQIAYLAGRIHLDTYSMGRNCGPRAPEKASKAREDLVLCISYLKEIAHTWAPGHVTAGILEGVLAQQEKAYLQPVIIQSYMSPPHPPPQSVR